MPPVYESHTLTPALAYDFQRYELIYRVAEEFPTEYFTPTSIEIIAFHHTRAIITRSRFETALKYKPRILRLRKVS